MLIDLTPYIVAAIFAVVAGLLALERRKSSMALSHAASESHCSHPEHGKAPCGRCSNCCGAEEYCCAQFPDRATRPLFERIRALEEDQRLLVAACEDTYATLWVLLAMDNTRFAKGSSLRETIEEHCTALRGAVVQATGRLPCAAEEEEKDR